MRAFALYIAVLLSLMGEGASASAASPLAAVETAALPADWYPESVAVSADGTFYIGSWRQGAVARLRPGRAKAEVLVPPGSNGLANGQGLLLDTRRRLLWICSGTMGLTTVPTTPSALKSYDLETGAARGSYVLPDQGYCNDLAQDKAGTLYITDSLHPRILRFRQSLGRLEIWKESPAFDSGASYFLNGIAIDHRDRLYVSPVMAASYLLRTQIEADGAAGPIEQIRAPRALKNADAIRSIDDDRLLIFESNAFGHDGPYGGTVTLAKLEGNQMTRLTPIVAGLNDPSSGVVWAGRVYFIESKYSLLLAHKNDPSLIPSGVPFALQSRPMPAP